MVCCHLLQQELQACLVPGWQLSLCRAGPRVGSCEKQKEGGLRTMARKHAETLMRVKARTEGTEDLNTDRRGRSLFIGCPDPHTSLVTQSTGFQPSKDFMHITPEGSSNLPSGVMHVGCWLPNTEFISAVLQTVMHVYAFRGQGSTSAVLPQ